MSGGDRSTGPPDRNARERRSRIDPICRFGRSPCQQRDLLQIGIGRKLAVCRVREPHEIFIDAPVAASRDAGWLKQMGGERR
jgi:hypothetical protein